MSKQTIRISAKCADLFSAQLLEPTSEVQSKHVQQIQVGEYDGYVPSWFPNPKEEHYGDYVQLDIDIETGQILNWRKPSAKELGETFKQSN